MIELHETVALAREASLRPDRQWSPTGWQAMYVSKVHEGPEPWTPDYDPISGNVYGRAVEAWGGDGEALVVEPLKGALVDATTDGTIGADVNFDPAGLRDAGFEKTEIVEPGRNGGRRGAVSGVVLSFAVPLAVPAIFMGLGLIIAFLQAFVFALLTMIYIGLALEEPH